MDSNGTIDLTFWKVAAAYLFILIVWFIIRIKKIPREKLIAIATLRMTLQLILIGYVLIFVFKYPHPAVTIAIIFFMLCFAIYNVYDRTEPSIHQSLKKMIALAMVLGIALSMLYMVAVVLQLDPWYEPRIFIPIGGMIIGKTMTGVALGVTNLLTGMKQEQDKVEAALMLGATPKQASKTIINQAFDAALLPTINAMVGMGIVFLPGMMTGQIIAGQSPLAAVKYQVAVMLGVAGTVAITIVIFLHLSYKSFFTSRNQFIITKRN
ncbi:ABC transporter permease [Virgibacillus sp. W0430]|uniref:ABC transporter permease n=1 Tax=Virgibacillus sp. W0430 TaxID=3391580 RepID=UPI003F453465